MHFFSPLAAAQARMYVVSRHQLAGLDLSLPHRLEVARGLDKMLLQNRILRFDLPLERVAEVAQLILITSGGYSVIQHGYRPIQMNRLGS
jgi:hypothetical protein